MGVGTLSPIRAGDKASPLFRQQQTVEKEMPVANYR
jgi:hypothetical protein